MTEPIPGVATRLPERSLGELIPLSGRTTTWNDLLLPVSSGLTRDRGEVQPTRHRVEKIGRGGRDKIELPSERRG